MDFDTDFGLFELIVLLGAVGVVIFLVVNAIKKIASGVFLNQFPGAATGVSWSQAFSNMFSGCWQIPLCSPEAAAIISCIKSSGGTQADAVAAINTENKLNAYPPAWYQVAWNYYFGTSYGVNLGTAAAPVQGNKAPITAGGKPCCTNCALGAGFSAGEAGLAQDDGTFFCCSTAYL